MGSPIADDEVVDLALDQVKSLRRLENVLPDLLVRRSIDLRAAHSKSKVNAGIDLRTGKVADMLKLDVVEPLRVGTQALDSAVDASTMILRIDDVIAAKGVSKADMAKAAQAAQAGGMGGMGGMPGMM